MEPQEYHYIKRNNCKCLLLIIAILFALFLGTLGLILGATQAAFFLAGLNVLIALAVIFGVLIALTVIYKICECNKKGCERKGC